MISNVRNAKQIGHPLQDRKVEKRSYPLYAILTSPYLPYARSGKNHVEFPDFFYDICIPLFVMFPVRLLAMLSASLTCR